MWFLWGVFYSNASYSYLVLLGAFPTKIPRIDLVLETINTGRVSTCWSHQLCGLFQEPVHPHFRKVAYTRYSIAYGCG